jgi:hypothetical protein
MTIKKFLEKNSHPKILGIDALPMRWYMAIPYIWFEPE